MFQKALVIAIVLTLAAVAYRAYLNVGDKTANWQMQTIELRNNCATLLAKPAREPKHVSDLRDKVLKLSWRSKVSDEIISDLSKTADPLQEEAVGAGIALDHCMKQLESPSNNSFKPNPLRGSA